MGTPTPPPPVVGENCAFCDDVHWPAGATPKFIHLTAIDLEECPAADVGPPNGIWVLQQLDGWPCDWEYDDGKVKWKVVVEAAGFVEGHTWRPDVGWRWAFACDLLGCVSSGDNMFTTCNGRNCKNGRIEIVWS